MIMESAPALFAGLVFLLFGAGLLTWAVTRAVRHAPVTYPARPAAIVMVTFFGAVSLAGGVWCLLQV
jgi:hypothetical protein